MQHQQSSQLQAAPAADHIITTVAIGDMSGGNLLSPDAFLAQYPQSWQELLKTGMSKYIRADGLPLSRKEGLRLMTVFCICRNVRQRVAVRMATIKAGGPQDWPAA